MEMFIWGTFLWFALLVIPGSFAISFIQSRKTATRVSSAREEVSGAFMISVLLAGVYFLLGARGLLSWGAVSLLNCLPAALSVCLAYVFMAVVNHRLILRSSGSIMLLGPLAMALTASLSFCASAGILRTLNAP